MTSGALQSSNNKQWNGLLRMNDFFVAERVLGRCCHGRFCSLVDDGRGVTIGRLIECQLYLCGSLCMYSEYVRDRKQSLVVTNKAVAYVAWAQTSL